MNHEEESMLNVFTNSQNRRLRCRRNSVLLAGIDSKPANRSDVNLGSKTMRAPWTPEPRRLGAYSARSAARSHSMTRWLVQRATSWCEGAALGCYNKTTAGFRMDV